MKIPRDYKNIDDMLMMTLKNYYETIISRRHLKELTAKVLDLIAQTKVEIGHKSDPKSLASLSKIFASDLIRERRFGKMTFNQVQDAFQNRSKIWKG